MSNRLFQTVIHQMKDIVGRTIGAIDENGIIVACSELAKIGEEEDLPYVSENIEVGETVMTDDFFDSSIEENPDINPEDIGKRKIDTNW